MNRCGKWMDEKRGGLGKKEQVEMRKRTNRREGVTPGG